MLAPLLVFVDRALTIDDALYLRAAEQILRDPLRPYDTMIDWYGTGEGSLWNIAKNPPGLSYWLAGVQALGGRAEAVLHLSMLPFAVVAVLAGQKLSARFAGGSSWATALWVASPAFLVSASTLMADVPALALSLAGAALYIEGVDGDHPPVRRLGALLVGVGIVVKYTVVVTLATVALYRVMVPARARRRSALADLWPAAIPLVVWSVVGLATRGRIHFIDSLSVGGGGLTPNPGWFLHRGIALSTFLAASGIFPLLFVVPKVAPFVGYRLAGVAVGLGVGAASLTGSIWPQRALAVSLAAGLLTVIGSAALLATAREVWNGIFKDCDRESLFLAVWVILQAGFAWFWSWTIAARFVLPLMPPLGLLVARSVSARSGGDTATPARASSGGRLRRGLLPATALMAFAVATIVLWADTAGGKFHRAMIPWIAARARAEGRQVRFVGTWGFFYYADRAGMRRLNRTHPDAHAGDLILQPYYVAENELPPGFEKLTTLLASNPAPVPPLAVHTVNQYLGANFYTSLWGPLPFAVGRRPAEGISIWLMNRDP